MRFHGTRPSSCHPRCITVRFFSVRTAISAGTDQNSFPRSIKHPLRTVITLHPSPSRQAATAQLLPSRSELQIKSFLGGRYNLWQNPVNPQNRIGVAIPRNQTKLLSSPCITVRFFSVRTAISACTDQNSLPRSIKHPRRTVITLHPSPSNRAATAQLLPSRADCCR